MTIYCEHFVYGLFNRSGYKTFYSDKAKEQLKKESLEKLKNLRLKKGQSNDVVTMHFPSEDIITRSYLQTTNDVYGREGIINHTVIMRTSDFLQEFPEVLDVAFNKVAPQFVDSAPSQVETIIIKGNVENVAKR